MKDQYIHIDREGTKRYYSDKAMTIQHRTDGPAIEYTDGDKVWYQNGKCHRTDGPAIECANDIKYWHLEGKQYSEQEFLAKMNPSPSCEGKIVEIEGKKYKLVSA